MILEVLFKICLQIRSTFLITYGTVTHRLHEADLLVVLQLSQLSRKVFTGVINIFNKELLMGNRTYFFAQYTISVNVTFFEVYKQKLIFIN